MLVYNVLDMSSMATPTRPARGVAVPGIDTHGPDEKALAINGWPVTPPHSAHDSRRPSLAYSALSDASHSGPPSTYGFSQPATPVCSMAQSQDFTAQWTDGADMHASISANLNSHCQNAHLGQPMFGVSFTQQQVANAQMYSSVARGNYPTMASASPAPDAWATLDYAQDYSPVTSFDQSGYLQCEPTQASLAPLVFQQPQHVVPSQVNAQEDYSMVSNAGYGTGGAMHENYMQSFDSTTAGYADFHFVPPASPMSACFDESDPEFVQVKPEYFSSPSRGTPISQPRQIIGACDSQRISRKGSRSLKRSRKSRQEGKAWFVGEINGTVVRCEGKQFEIKDNMVITHESKDSKRHRCTYEEVPGQSCDSRFDRSEHLKRHMGSHLKNRPYHCPVDGCRDKDGRVRTFTRSDNTSDHFKTHLKVDAKGRRNSACTFKHLETRILEKYDEKRATKLLNGLRKWNANKEAIQQAKRLEAAYQ